MTNWLPISELFDFEKGTVQSTKATSGEYTFITAGEDWKTHNEYTHDCEALIFAMGASGSLGRTHYFSGKFISSDLCFILTPKKDKKIDLLFYYRIFNFIRADIVKATARGTSKLAINQRNFGKYKLPYFDFDHQMLFRDKLDNLNSSKDKLILELDLQQSFLIKLRQSILKDAVEGKLTTEWRKQNPVIKGDPNTDANALLVQMKEEKQKLILEKKVKKENPLSPLMADEEPFELPDGWVWVKIGQIVESITYGTSQSCSYDSTQNAKVLRIPNVSKGYIDNEDLKFTDLSDKEIYELSLKFGDVLVVRSNGSPKIVGTMAIVPEDFIGYCFAGYLIRFRFSITAIAEYIKIISTSFHIRQQIEVPLRTTVGINNINTQELSELTIPFPSLSEQKEIINQVNLLFHKVDELERQINIRKHYAQSLMQAVLNEAFTPT